MKLLTILSTAMLLAAASPAKAEVLQCAEDNKSAKFFEIAEEQKMAIFHDTTDMKEIVPFLQSTGWNGPIEGLVHRVIVIRAIKGSIDDKGGPHPNIGWAYVGVFKDDCYINGTWITSQSNKNQEKYLKQMNANLGPSKLSVKLLPISLPE